MKDLKKKLSHDPLVEILKRDFEAKKSRNSSYSLRAYSLYLGVDPSNLSKILSYQLVPKDKLKRKLAEKVGLDQQEVTQILGLYRTGTHDSTFHRDDLEHFNVIADWYHYALLELVTLKACRHEAGWMASELGLPVKTVREALARLIKLGYLSVTPDGRYVNLEEASSSIIGIGTSLAHRNGQKQILEKAIQAIDEVPVDLRSQTSMTMAIDRKKLPEAKELIKEFRRGLGRYLTDSKDLDEVYHLSISLYPITQIHQEDKK